MAVCSGGRGGERWARCFDGTPEATTTSVSTSNDRFRISLGRISRTHVYALPPSLAAVELATAGKCGARTGLIIYNGEHWQATPPDEQADMAKAIERGKGIVRQSGCEDYGIAPDGQYIGISAGKCRYDPAASIYRAIDWTGISLFDIQAQRLLGGIASSAPELEPMSLRLGRSSAMCERDRHFRRSSRSCRFD